MARRLSPLDIAFLQMETPEAPSHIASLQIFEPPPGYKGSFVADLKADLEAIPVGAPFNLKLSPKGLPFSFPTWVPDNNFDIDFHLRHSALPKPGRMDQLMKLVSRLHGRLLDRTRPLWEMYLIEGLEGNRFALYTKIHHALVDGVGGMKMIDQSFSRSPDDFTIKAPWAIEQIEKRIRANRTVTEKATRTAKSVLGPIRALPQVLKAIALPGKTEAAIAFQTSKTVFNGHITASRRFAIHSLPLAETKEIGKILGHTVNDLFLAISAAALKRYLDEKGMTPALPLTATVPVSLQTKDSNKQGNQISYVAVNLRTDMEDPLERLKAIGRSAAAAKSDMSSLTRDAVQTLAVVAQSTAALINQFRLSEIVKPPANLVISNVPGPRDTLYFKGAKLIGYYPLSILMDGQALNITLCSHANQLDFGILGCRSAMPDLESLGTYIGDAYNELKSIALGISATAKPTAPGEESKPAKKPTAAKKARTKNAKAATTQTDHAEMAPVATKKSRSSKKVTPPSAAESVSTPSSDNTNAQTIVGSVDTTTANEHNESAAVAETTA
jgi:diacylglycerol O-acyltransferase / wax synthase